MHAPFRKRCALYVPSHLNRHIHNLKLPQVTSHRSSTALMSPLVSGPSPPALTASCHLRLVLGNLAAWSHGACIVYPSQTFDPRAIVDALVHEKCTALHGVPTHFFGVLAEVERRKEAGEELDLGSLRCVDYA